VLTSRPGVWNGQLTIAGDDPLQRAGELLPLRYPDDVAPFVDAWFSGRPALAAKPGQPA
jgi:hypothetical protein